MKTALITGCNRGIGLELTKQLQEKGYQVIALCRKSSDELDQLGCRVIEGAELTDLATLKKIKKEIQDVSIDLLINNAGLLERTTLQDLNFDSIQKQFEVNAMAPLKVVDVFKDQLKKGSKVILMTSRMGSIADNTSGGSYGYRMSKAALNIAGVSLSHDLASQGIAVGIIHPGYVQTDMTHHSGDITPDVSAERIIQRIDEISLQNTGTFYHSNGQVLPW